MKELVELTQTSKSTILYYVKEGLLAQPEKPKPNLHLYDESCVETIKFIKYLQNNFDCSINELKELVNDGAFNLDGGFESALNTLDAIMGSKHQKTFTSEDLCKKYNISSNKLEDFVLDGLLFKRGALFTAKEEEILALILNLEAVGVQREILLEYVEHAKQMAIFEVSFAKIFLKDKKNKNDAVKALFDTTLILKPYLFNMQTLKLYQENRS
jgi:DNA-binding transcriptional MerR regulator